VPVKFPVAVVFTEGLCCAPLEGPLVLYTSAFTLLLLSCEQDTAIKDRIAAQKSTGIVFTIVVFIILVLINKILSHRETKNAASVG
jgi:hypothetical protein